MPEKTKTWSAPTSPRSPYKLPHELQLLQPFVGKLWSRDIQREFAEHLKTSEEYEGHIYEAQPDWSARDRINRAPLTFGFVRLQPIIALTPAGKQLIAGHDTETLFLKQLLKWQYPSPKHGDRFYQRRFCIRPFLETLRLVYECDGLTKDEIALFAVPLTKYTDYPNARRALLGYRAELRTRRAPDRRRFRAAYIQQVFRKIYREDISRGRLQTRQSATKTVEAFVMKKYRNTRDYADAAMRYFRATGLFSLSAASSRLTVRAHKRVVAAELLEQFPRRPTRYDQDQAQFLDELGDPAYPLLPSDQPNVINVEISSLEGQLQKLGMRQDELEVLKNRHQGADLLSAFEQELKQRNRAAMTASLRDGRYRQEIMQFFANPAGHRTQDEPWDRALLFEWNLWRAFEMLNQGDIHPNLLLDDECQPLEHAPGKHPDMKAFYSSFVLVIEGTLSTGERQYDAEGEAVARHYGAVAQELLRAGDKRPIYGLFIAPRISDASVALFFTLRKQHVVHYGGLAKFVPLSTGEFNQLLAAAGHTGVVNVGCVFRALQAIDRAAENARDEKEWIGRVQEVIANVATT